MLTLLINVFIKNKDNVSDGKVREKYGTLCGGYGIFLNVVLFAIKYFAGIISNSIAMTADAFNNLSDAGSSLISVISFKLAGKEPDPEHPFGHGRLEYLSGIIISAIIVVMGYELAKESVEKIFTPDTFTFSFISIIILLVSILIKFYMAFYTKRIGNLIDSDTLRATSVDSLSDTISTFAVLLCTLITYFTGLQLDGICGTLVGIFIIIAGIKTAMETISPLLGEPPSADFVKAVKDIVLAHKEIVGVHDLIVHNYGPGRLMITLHAEVPDNGDIVMLHDVVDNAEVELKKTLNCHATIHMDPVAVGNPKVDELKKYVSGVLKSIDGSMTFHDFRTVFGPTHTNLIFDVVVSFNDKRSNEEIAALISEKISNEHNDYLAVINVDRDFCKEEEK